jgi:hypothetical protein
MTQFANKEEYEKWKAGRSKELEERIESKNKEEILEAKAIESTQVRNDSNSNLQKTTFLILSIIAFLGLFGISKIALSPVGGFIVQLGFPFLIFLFSLLLIVLSFINLLKHRMEHFALGIRLLCIGNLILICSFVAFASHVHSKSLNNYRILAKDYRTLAEEKGRLALKLEDSVNKLYEKAESDSEARYKDIKERIKERRDASLANNNAQLARIEAERKAREAENKVWELERPVGIGFDELFGAIFVLFGNLGIIVLSFFSRLKR